MLTPVPARQAPFTLPAWPDAATALALAIDAHAYYLKHQNRRGDYLDGWRQVVNWKAVSDRFAAAQRR